MTLPSDQLFRVRVEKAQNLRDKGIDPYPRNFDRTHTAGEAVQQFESAGDFGRDSDSQFRHRIRRRQDYGNARHGQSHILRHS